MILKMNLNMNLVMIFSLFNHLSKLKELPSLLNIVQWMFRIVIAEDASTSADDDLPPVVVLEDLGLKLKNKLFT